jgi:hypothetical protein
MFGMNSSNTCVLHYKSFLRIATTKKKSTTTKERLHSAQIINGIDTWSKGHKFLQDFLSF